MRQGKAVGDYWRFSRYLAGQFFSVTPQILQPNIDFCDLLTSEEAWFGTLLLLLLEWGVVNMFTAFHSIKVVVLHNLGIWIRKTRNKASLLRTSFEQRLAQCLSFSFGCLYQRIQHKIIRCFSAWLFLSGGLRSIKRAHRHRRACTKTAAWRNW